MTRLSWRDYVPETREARAFTLVMLVSAVGLGLFLSGSTIFYVRVVGLTPAQIGLGLAVSAAVGLATTVPIGALADRLGAPRMLVALQLWRAGWFAALAFVRGPVGFLVVASCLAIAEAATAPTVQAIIGTITAKADRTRTMAIIRTVRNVGFSGGALLAAAFVVNDDPWGYRGLVLCNAAAFVLAAVILVRLHLPYQPPARRESPWRALQGLHVRYLALAGLNGALSLHMTLLSVGLPLWVLSATVLPQSAVPLAVTVNTVLAVVLQVALSKGAARPGGAAQALRLAGLSLAGCVVALAVAAKVPLVAAAVALLVGTVLLTLGELWQAAGGWELSFEHARDERRTTDLAAFSLGTSAQSIVGPPLVTAVVAQGTVGWLALAAGFVLLVLLVSPVVRALDRARDARAGEPEPVTV